MIVRNPSGRPVKLEVLAADGTAMTLTLGPRTAVDLARYERAPDVLDRIEIDITDPAEAGSSE